MPLGNIDDKATQFLQLLNEDLNKNKIYLDPTWRADHICYRTSDAINYESTKKAFAERGTLLGETEVNGRNIATYRLQNPILWNQQKIWLVEVPAPKKPGTKEGFEHMELICDCPFETLKLMYPQAKWDQIGSTKPYNPELEIVMGERNIKFHHQSLSSVMRLEKNKKIWDALIESNLLNVLRPWHPHVVGTFPLGLETETSDLDILLTLKDSANLKEKLESFLPETQNPKWKETNNTLSLSFIYREVTFDLYAEPTLSYHQKAAKHFRTEERLIESGNKDLIEKIKELRKGGMKTEPSFAAALGLTGDPYELMLDYSRD